MDDLLFLAHRIPYPPNKGDKIRSFHILKFLGERYRVHLGTFIDQAADRRYADRVREHCASAWFGDLSPTRARLASLPGLATGEALTLPYYRRQALARWVRSQCQRHGIRRAFVYSAAMAQYLDEPAYDALRRIIDFVDVDSDKWRQYSASKSFPWNWLYAREAQRLSRFEGRIAARFDASLFVSEAEARLFSAQHPPVSNKVHALRNGVDTGYFAPDPGRVSPFAGAHPVCVFTGAMDYWANEDGVAWFAQEVLPRLRQRAPGAEFHIVGMNPTASVRQLAERPGVMVTGAVPDVRPYLQHADVVVVPLRIARGIQNKVLEAMAMARPVVATTRALEGIDAVHGRDVLAADEAGDFAAAVQRAAIGEQAAIGASARAFVERHFAWEASLPRLIELVEGSGRGGPTGRGGRASWPIR